MPGGGLEGLWGGVRFGGVGMFEGGVWDLSVWEGPCGVAFRCLGCWKGVKRDAWGALGTPNEEKELSWAYIMW